jgi:hypothetical protein
MTNSSWANSNCKGTWLHRFKITEQYGNAVKEVCEICGKSKVFKIDESGRTNNLEYVAYHIRQVLVPQHKLYQHEYGN